MSRYRDSNWKRTRTTSFNPAYKQNYRLCHSVHASNSSVVAVFCLFCLSIGREVTFPITMKSRKAKNNKVFDCSLIDLYKNNLEEQHVTRWEKYQSLWNEGKLVYFQPQIQYREIIPAILWYLGARACLLHRQNGNDVLTETLVGEYMQDVFLGKVIFDHDQDFYRLTIEHGDNFDVTLEYVSLGMSFRLVSRLIQIDRSYSYWRSFHSVSEGLVKTFVQASVSINLQRTRTLIFGLRCWSYSVAFDCLSNYGTGTLMFVSDMQQKENS